MNVWLIHVSPIRPVTTPLGPSTAHVHQAILGMEGLDSTVAMTLMNASQDKMLAQSSPLASTARVPMHVIASLDTNLRIQTVLVSEKTGMMMMKEQHL